MRGLLIYPKANTITEVTYTDDYKNIYTHIGADCFDIVRLNAKDTLFVDGNGLVNGEDNGRFYVEGKYPVILAGKGLLLSTDEEGESIGTKMPMEELTAMIKFGEVVRVNGELAFMTTEGHFLRVPE